MFRRVSNMFVNMLPASAGFCAPNAVARIVEDTHYRTRHALLTKPEKVALAEAQLIELSDPMGIERCLWRVTKHLRRIQKLQVSLWGRMLHALRLPEGFPGWLPTLGNHHIGPWRRPGRRTRLSTGHKVVPYALHRHHTSPRLARAGVAAPQQPLPLIMATRLWKWRSFTFLPQAAHLYLGVSCADTAEVEGLTRDGANQLQQLV